MRATATNEGTAPWRQAASLALAGTLLYFVFQNDLPLMTRIMVMALLVLSLDLVVGYAGLATLGHVAFFGIGAYAAGITALRLTGDPFVGLAAGALAGALAAGASGALLLRYEGFTFLMLTVAFVQIVQSLASKLRDWTGGDDGLTGFSVKPLLGASFDMQGHTAYWYVLALLVICYWVAKRIVESPFGLSVQGIRQSRLRMAALGTDVRWQLWRMYTIAGAMAGVAGALSAQSNGIVGLDSLSFELSAEILAMLILGGTGRLYGALIGAAVFMLLHHTASSINPYHWLFAVGALLMIAVLLPRQALEIGALKGLWKRARRREAP